MPVYRYSKDAKLWYHYDHTCCAGLMDNWGEGHRYFEVLGHRLEKFELYPEVHEVLGVVPNSAAQFYNAERHRFVFDFTNTDWGTAAMHLYECQYMLRDARSSGALLLLRKGDHSEDSLLAHWMATALRWHGGFTNAEFSMYHYGCPFGNKDSAFDACVYIWARFMEVELPKLHARYSGELPQWSIIFAAVGDRIRADQAFVEFRKRALQCVKQNLPDTIKALLDVVNYLKEVKHERTKNVLDAAPVPVPAAGTGDGTQVQQAPAAGERQPAARPAPRAKENQGAAQAAEPAARKPAPRKRKYPRVKHGYKGFIGSKQELSLQYREIDGYAFIAIWRNGKKKVLPGPGSVNWLNPVGEYRKATAYEIKLYQRRNP